MLVDHAHEAGVASLVRAVGEAVGVGRGDEEHVARLDESRQRLGEGLARHPGQPIGEPARVESVLQLALPLVIAAVVDVMLVRGHDAPPV